MHEMSFFGFKGSVRNWIISAFNRFRKCDLQKCKYEFSPPLFEVFQGKHIPRLQLTVAEQGVSLLRG